MAPDPHRTVGPGSICFELAGAADTPATTHFPFPAEPARAATVDDCGVGARQSDPGFDTVEVPALDLEIVIEAVVVGARQLSLLLGVSGLPGR